MSRISTVICSSCGDHSFDDATKGVDEYDEKDVVSVVHAGQSQMKRLVILDFLVTWGPVASNYCHLSIAYPLSLVAMLLLLQLIRLFLEVMYPQLNRMNWNLPLKRELSMSLGNQVVAVGGGDGALSDLVTPLDSLTHQLGRKDLDHLGRYFDWFL